jgi:hypothetical protein
MTVPWQRMAPPFVEIWEEGRQSGTHTRRGQVVRLNLSQQHGDYSPFPKGFILHSAIYLPGAGLKSGNETVNLPETGSGKSRMGEAQLSKNGGFPPF